MKQILLVTDGCSNEGVSPVVAAAHALAEGITVNVIGVLDEGENGRAGAEEIAEIARAGGGMSRQANRHNLNQTMHMVTRHTVAQTIQQAVQRELRQVLGGDGKIESLPPDKRGEVVKVVDELSESADLQVVLLVDVSASMRPKLRAVEEAIHDLMLSLQARAGRSELAVFHFPGQKQELCTCLQRWTSSASSLQELVPRLQVGGITPTGPAIMQVIDFYRERGYGKRKQAELQEESSLEGLPNPSGTDGIMRDYVV